MIGDVAPDNEYQTSEDKAAGRPVRQKIDEVTGKRQWKGLDGQRNKINETIDVLLD